MFDHSMNHKFEGASYGYYGYSSIKYRNNFCDFQRMSLSLASNL